MTNLLVQLMPLETPTNKKFFETELIMKGDLMKPTISFDIVLPDGNNSVSAEVINTTQSKLTQLRQQPDELNKHLLLFESFYCETLSSEAGSSVASIARESASKTCRNTNNLAGNFDQWCGT
jgi:hypothetical protein